MNADVTKGFDDANRPVPVVEFDYDAADLQAELAEARERIAEFEARLQVEKRDHKADNEHYKDRLELFQRFIFDTLISDKPSATVAGYRAYFCAQMFLKEPPFLSWVQMAEHLHVTGGAISQQLKKFLAENPKIAEAKRAKVKT